MERRDLPLDAAYRLASRAAAIGLAVNLTLGAAKLAGGWIAGSFALGAAMAEALGPPPR